MGPSVSPGGEVNGRPAHVPRKSCDDGFAVGVEEDMSTLRLHVSGSFDWARVGHVEAALAQIGQAGIEHVIFDLRKLEFMDAAGLRTILRANDRARTEPFDVVVVRPRGLANRVFTLTRASKALTLVDSPAGTGRGT